MNSLILQTHPDTSFKSEGNVYCWEISDEIQLYFNPISIYHHRKYWLCFSFRHAVAKAALVHPYNLSQTFIKHQLCVKHCAQKGRGKKMKPCNFRELICFGESRTKSSKLKYRFWLVLQGTQEESERKWWWWWWEPTAMLESVIRQGLSGEGRLNWDLMQKWTSPAKAQGRGCQAEECVQKPEAGGALGMSELEKEDQWGWSSE